MADTTWITSIKNESNKNITWKNGEHPDFGGYLTPNAPQTDYDGTGLCFPWVDHTRDELGKAIVVVDSSNSTILFRIFQSYNRDTIQWIKGAGTIANHAVDVAGESGAGGSKGLIIQRDGSPKIVITG
jgi:hypothetical protein